MILTTGNSKKDRTCFEPQHSEDTNNIFSWVASPSGIIKANESPWACLTRFGNEWDLACFLRVHFQSTGRLKSGSWEAPSSWLVTSDIAVCVQDLLNFKLGWSTPISIVFLSRFKIIDRRTWSIFWTLGVNPWTLSTIGRKNILTSYSCGVTGRECIFRSETSSLIWTSHNESIIRMYL